MTDVLKCCPADKELTGPIRAMRAVCRKFLDEIGYPDSPHRIVYSREAAMVQALGEMRGVFGLHLTRLCTAFGVDVEPDLSSIFPYPDMEDEKSRDVL